MTRILTVWRTSFILCVALSGCCATTDIDWDDEVGKFFKKIADMWGAGQIEDMVNDIYVCDPVRLAPDEEAERDPEVIKQAYAEIYAAGFIEIQPSVQHVLPNGDKSAVVWLTYTFSKQDGSGLSGKVMFFLVNQWGKIKIKLLIYH